MKMNVCDSSGKVLRQTDVGFVDLPEEKSDALMYQSVRSQLTNRRAGLASTKGRSVVSGGGKKPYKQKGTGNARQGSTRSPNHVGGGIVFGPSPRKFYKRMNKKMAKKALLSALLQKLQDEQCYMLEGWSLDKPSTKSASQLINAIDEKGSVLVVGADQKVLDCSVRNLKRAKYLDVDGLNVFDILKYQKLLLTEGSVEALGKRWAQ